MSFRYRLELASGEPAEPPHFTTATPTWRVGDSIFLGPGRRLRVVALRVDTAEDDSGVLVVEEV